MMCKIDNAINKSSLTKNALVKRAATLLTCGLTNNFSANSKKSKILLLFVLFSALTVINAQPIKAFPTANGAGAYATGGRGKPVYIVTNLNNSGTGSFRQALENTKTTDGGIITFAVSGTIVLTSKLELRNKNNITIAGQTSPSGGITIVGSNSAAKLVLFEMSNFIIRYVRFRPSYPTFPLSELDALNISNCSNYIIDHCSISWGTDENADSGDGNNYTWQRNLFAESNKTGMIMGAQTDKSENMSFINNMFYNCSKRFPNYQSNGRVDVINNVIWNFRTLISVSQGGHDLNHIGNYYKYFRDSPAADEGRWNLWYPFNGTSDEMSLIKYPSIYTSGNYISDVLTNPNSDNYFTWRWRFNPVGSPYEGAAPNSQLTSDFKANSQFPLLGIPFAIQSAADSFENVRYNVGANTRLNENGSRIEEIDGPDTVYLNNVQNDIRVNYTPETNLSTPHFNAFQASISTVPINKHPSSYDSNNDGIPNQWIISKGFNVNDDITTYVWPSGYVGIEEYLNEVDKTSLPNVTPDCSQEITSFPYSEGFENTLGAWTQSSLDDTDWIVDANGTPSSGTGPSNASQGAYYVYVEASGSGTGFPTKQALLNSPCFNLSGLSQANFSFKYHQYGSVDMGSVILEASDDNGVNWTSIWASSGNLGDSWLTANVDLGAFLGGSLKLRFNRVTGSTWQADIAIDDVSLVVVNTIVDTCSKEITSFPYYEGFENTLGAWTQSSLDDTDWTVDTDGTPSSGTGPSRAYQDTYYIYVEASGTGFPTKQALLNSPCFNLSGLSQANFNFKYHQYGSVDMGSIDLEASDDNGVNWTSIWTSSGNLGDSWQSASVNLSAYTGGSVQLRFNRVTGSDWQADIAIDEVSLTESNNLVDNGCSEGIVSFPYFEGFENTLGAWTQSSSDDIDWTVDANGTPSNGTGPSSASQGTYYVYVEASGNNLGFPTKQAVLLSPCYDLSAQTSATFSFKYHQFGESDMGTIDLEISPDNGDSWLSIWTSSGNLGDSWQSASVNLSAYTGGSVQLRFNRITGSGWQADIAIDEVSLSTNIMARMQAETSVFEDEKKIILYPNPVRGNILYMNSNSTNVSYEIYDMVGQLVSKGNVKNNRIDVSNLGGAIYRISFSSEGDIITKQFIKQ